MSSNLFEKIIKIVQVCLTILEVALKSFKGIGDDVDSDKVN